VRALVEVDRVLASTNWRTLPDRFATALAMTTCDEGAWIEVAPAFGFAEQSLARSRRMIECDPLNFYPYYAAAMELLWAGRPDEALETTRRGLEVAPDDPFLEPVSVKALVAQGRLDEALARAESGKSWSYEIGMTTVLAAMGDRVRAREFSAVAIAETGPWQEMYMRLQLAAITGDRAAANQAAAWYDGVPGGQLMLASALDECMCGVPFDLKVTPIFAERLAEAGVSWPPPTIIDYPTMRE